MRARLVWALALMLALLAVLIVPPMVSVSRYRSRITQLLSASLGRPVRLSSVEVRLLPRPGFVLSDLTVEEDPAYGAEPILHANTVTASIRLLSLWRGRLEIGQISVDEASLNLVRNPAGSWNLDSLFRNAAAKSGAPARRPLPYLEATNSRINVKNGVEKLPFSLVDTDLSFWQANPGDWRIRLRGQPARTDLSLQLGDTGTVRLEGSLRRAEQLSQMPVHLDLEWREAQLGQLSRLLVGSDPGWRGNLTGELHLDGTAESAKVITRLRAEGVHRAEFAPVSPLDFDARCGFTYHFTSRAVEALSCDSPLGEGHIRLSGNLPGNQPDGAGQPRLTVELDKIQVAAGLDALRTVRSDFAPGIQAKGTISGKLVYAQPAPDDLAAKPSAQTAVKPVMLRGRAAKTHPSVTGPLTGSLGVQDFELSGAGLSAPVAIAKVLLEPVAGEEALTANASIPAGGSAPLTISARLALDGYQIAVHGQAAVARARELAHVAGVPNATLLDALMGDPLTVDLTADGPWMAAEKIPFASTAALPSVAMASAVPLPSTVPASDRIAGTIVVRNANWKSEYLANHLLISQATLHLDEGGARWEPVAFTYGPVKGTASLTLPANCPACVPHFQVQFAQLDASALQAAVLGAQQKVTVISTLLERLRPSAPVLWPRLEGTIQADSMVLGPVTLRGATAELRMVETGAEIGSFDANFLGGRVHGSASLQTPRNPQEKPAYSLDAKFEKLNPAAVGLLLDQHWSGGAMDASGKVELTGFTQSDLAASAKGLLHFDWQRGAVSGSTAPADLTRFDRWSADAEIGGGTLTLKQNEVRHGTKSSSAQASATLGSSPKLTFVKAAQTQAKR